MSTSLGSTLPAAAREPMLALAREGAGGDARVEAERFQQILDCATGRLFRRALFVRARTRRTAPDVGVLRTAWLASGIDRDDDGARRVEGREYAAPPDVDRALIALRQVAPATMSFEALASALGGARRPGARPGEAWGEGVLEVLAEPPRIVVNPERPRVGWPARVDVALGRDYATNLNASPAPGGRPRRRAVARRHARPRRAGRGGARAGEARAGAVLARPVGVPRGRLTVAVSTPREKNRRAG
ncbi:MAG: hypothetical protein U1F43_19225 [Myxococcota bacterium]